MVEPIDRRPFFIQREHRSALKKILRHAGRIVGRRGCATIAELAAKVSKETGKTTDADFVRMVVTTKPDFEWLDEASGWFWLTDVPRSNLWNYAEKILSASPGMDMAEFRYRVMRHSHMKEFSFPGRVLQTIRDRIGG